MDRTNFIINKIKFTAIIANSGKWLSLKVIAEDFEIEKEVTINTTTYYLLKLLNHVEKDQLPKVEEAIKRIEKGLIREGEVINYFEPIRVKEDLSITISKERPSNSNGKPQVALAKNEFFIKGISSVAIRLNSRFKRQENEYEIKYKSIRSILSKSLQLLEEYKKIGFEELAARKSTGLENDVLFELAQLYTKKEHLYLSEGLEQDEVIDSSEFYDEESASGK